MAKKLKKRPSPLPDPSSSSDSEEQHAAAAAEEEEHVQVSSEEEEVEEEQQPQPDSDSDQPPIARRSAAKRAAENNADPEGAKNKKNKAVVVDDAKKRFQRVWSVEDETAILKGLAEFISKTGNDPLKHGDAFYDFMKNSLQLDSNTKHLMQKVRRLRYKFLNHAAKGYNGDGSNFPEGHFDLCNNIWGSTEPKSKSKSISTEAAEENPNSNSNAMNVTSSSAKNAKSDKQVVDSDVETSLLLRSVMIGYENLGVNLNEDVLKKGLELIGASKREELEARWSKLQVAELELVAKRAQLIHDQSRIILEAYKSSNN